MLDENLRGTNMIVADTFDYNSHVFELISESEQFYLKFEQDSRLIKRLVIKPDIWIIFKDGGYEHGVKMLRPINPIKKKVLVKDFFIDPDIFSTLIEKELISYSKAMADLYQLPVAYSRDIQYHRNDYKRKEQVRKEQVLAKLRAGNFN